MLFRRTLLAMALPASASGRGAMAQGPKPLVREVGDGWTWFEDYVFAWAEWTVNCPPDRTCQVGMGVKAPWGGGPLGEKIRFSGAQTFTTVGLGAIHLRVVDGRGPCRVRLDRGNVGLVPIIDATSP